MIQSLLESEETHVGQHGRCVLWRFLVHFVNFHTSLSGPATVLSASAKVLCRFLSFLRRTLIHSKQSGRIKNSHFETDCFKEAFAHRGNHFTVSYCVNDPILKLDAIA